MFVAGTWPAGIRIPHAQISIESCRQQYVACGWKKCQSGNVKVMTFVKGSGSAGGIFPRRHAGNRLAGPGVPDDGCSVCCSRNQSGSVKIQIDGLQGTALVISICIDDSILGVLLFTMFLAATGCQDVGRSDSFCR